MFQGVGRDEKKVRGGGRWDWEKAGLLPRSCSIVNFFFGILSLREGERYSMGFNALKRSALYKPLFLNYCHHMPRSQFLGIIGSV